MIYIYICTKYIYDIYIYIYIYITTSSFTYVYDHQLNKDVTNIYLFLVLHKYCLLCLIIEHSRYMKYYSLIYKYL